MEPLMTTTTMHVEPKENDPHNRSLVIKTIKNYYDYPVKGSEQTIIWHRGMVMMTWVNITVYKYWN